MDKSKKKTKEPKKNPYELGLEIKTNSGKLNAIYEYSSAHDRFMTDFQKYIKEPDGYESWLFAVGHAHEIFKELIPQILEEALEQAWLEAKARTLSELNNKPFFLKHENQTDSQAKIQAIQVFDIPKEEIKKICQETADKARKSSHHRMKTDELIKRGGSERKLSGYDYGNLDYFYDYYYSQAKSILTYYRWKKELWEDKSRLNSSNTEWNKVFLNTMFQNSDNEFKVLHEKLINAENNQEKRKFKSLEMALRKMLNFESDEIKMWKKTFYSLLAEDLDTNEILWFDDLKPEKLTYHFLAKAFEVKYETKFDSGTIENNIKRIRRDKKEMLKLGN